MKRNSTKEVRVGNLTIGGGNPIIVQSMTNTFTEDVPKTVEQIKQLENAGCELVRVAVPNMESAKAIADIKKEISIPLVADIHFDHLLAISAVENGVDKLRINPGNIGSAKNVREVVAAARERGIPIRIGVNSGSISSWALQKYGRSAKGMVESALEHVRILESHQFYDIVISMKATDIPLTIGAYELISSAVEYPLHLGITEAGTKWFGSIKSACGIGALLSRGIGDTIRVSLTSDPIEEIKTAWAILSAMDLRRRGPIFISCPTCGRTRIPLEQIAIEVEERLQDFPLPLSIATMGCPVNGPGEARDADLGIAGGDGFGYIFRKGKIVRKVPQEQLIDALIAEAWSIIDEEGHRR